MSEDNNTESTPSMETPVPASQPTARPEILTTTFRDSHQETVRTEITSGTSLDSKDQS